MANCSHGFTAPNDIIRALPICQAGEGRHKCAVCAYAQGLMANQGKVFNGPTERCDQGHDNAPLDMLRALPVSQAGLERHRCVYRAFQEGKKAGALLGYQDEADAADDAEEANILARTDIGGTEKEQLVLARRGQGVFRQNVSLLSKRCRVTGVEDPRFLIAGHIKPWRECSDSERLDGFNGFMLSPHGDHLFDKGWITFSLSGDLIRSPHLPEPIWQAWCLGNHSESGVFDHRYAPYLDYHREKIFRR